MKVKEESEKVGLKLNIQKTKIMASSPITSGQIGGEKIETVRDFILGAPKSLQMVAAVMKLKDVYSLEEKLLKGCCCTQRHWDSWPPEEKNSIRGQRRGLIAQSFCVIKFY